MARIWSKECDSTTFFGICWFLVPGTCCSFFGGDFGIDCLVFTHKKGSVKTKWCRMPKGPLGALCAIYKWHGCLYTVFCEFTSFRSLGYIVSPHLIEKDTKHLKPLKHLGFGSPGNICSIAYLDNCLLHVVSGDVHLVEETWSGTPCSGAAPVVAQLVGL